MEEVSLVLRHLFTEGRIDQAEKLARSFKSLLTAIIETDLLNKIWVPDLKESFFLNDVDTNPDFGKDIKTILFLLLCFLSFLFSFSRREKVQTFRVNGIHSMVIYALFVFVRESCCLTTSCNIWKTHFCSKQSCRLLLIIKFFPSCFDLFFDSTDELIARPKMRTISWELQLLTPE
jgi:hypothetical protein